MDELFIAKKETLSKPDFKFNDLHALEIYYQKIIYGMIR